MFSLLLQFIHDLLQLSLTCPGVESLQLLAVAQRRSQRPVRAILEQDGAPWSVQVDGMGLGSS